MSKPLSPVMSPPTATSLEQSQPPGSAGSAGPDPRGGGASSARAGVGVNSVLSSSSEILSLESFPFSEALFSNALGVPPRNVTNVRVKKLARGTDWEMDGGTVVLTGKSVAVLAAALGHTLNPSALLLLLDKSRRGPAVVQFTARVNKRQPANLKLLAVTWREGELEQTANLITIRRDNFRVGMEVPIRLNPTTQRYELARTAPRAKGRW